ncbi:flavin-containing monooxygenase [Fodinicola acaciae]|uniref:flavin-containing monooxygenase n=1 Tax=Fodinicola acaciae TaxID=2681555 RepID=UPI0013D2CB2D|nr:NAD(P)/FAD-dependent oxidoreductase [Fodinicola acaciae]
MSVEHVDVLIVGAGLSGIGAASHLQDECPGRTFTILEARDAIGGTWDLFRYPGVRSDSDMFTLGYSFRPWKQAKSIADGPSIRSYVRATAAERGITEKIRFHHKVVRADWSSADARWLVDAERTDTGEVVRLSCDFLFSCSGYYNYDQGYTPDFPGVDDFAGEIVHPQFWPEDLDYTGKRVVVIGSGATAVTLVPSMAEKAAKVTMLQRSPSYLLTLPSTDWLADKIIGRLPDSFVYPAVRWQNVAKAMLAYNVSQRAPEFAKKLLRKGVVAQLPDGFDVDKHFSPAYKPWDQRMCFVPDGDFFRAVRDGKADIATDTIDTFTRTGIRLSSGEELPADIVVTATGLNLLGIGGVQLTLDGEPVELGKTIAYKGMMLSGVPNFALTVGYTNASWTLKADLVAHYVCRLLNHLDRHGYRVCTPRAPATDELVPLIDLKSGYVKRSAHLLPKQGPVAPWRLYQNYVRDRIMLRHGSLADAGMRFSRAPLRKPAAVS